MNEPVVITLDDRDRTSLAKINKHENKTFFASKDEDGTIKLVPVEVVVKNMADAGRIEVGRTIDRAVQRHQPRGDDATFA